MKRVLNVSKLLVDFYGTPIKLTEEKDMTLQDGLILYLRNASRMGLSDSDQNTAYTLGFLIGKGEKEVEMTTEQYDCLKRITDSGQVVSQNGTKDSLLSLEAKGQIKELVDAAIPLEEKESKK